MKITINLGDKLKEIDLSKIKTNIPIYSLDHK